MKRVWGGIRSLNCKICFETLGLKCILRLEVEGRVLIEEYWIRFRIELDCKREILGRVLVEEYWKRLRVELDFES